MEALKKKVEKNLPIITTHTNQINKLEKGLKDALEEIQRLKRKVG